jgi:hypothetical protein
VTTGQAGSTGIPCAMGYGLYAPSPVSGLDSHRRLPFVTGRLDPSVGRSGPRDFAVRVRHARPSCHPRPSHPRPTVRDDRPKRPSSSRRDARDAACDLPDEASADGCGRLARRAKLAWEQCGALRCKTGHFSIRHQSGTDQDRTKRPREAWYRTSPSWEHAGIRPSIRNCGHDALVCRTGDNQSSALSP